MKLKLIFQLCTFYCYFEGRQTMKSISKMTNVTQATAHSMLTRPDVDSMNKGLINGMKIGDGVLICAPKLASG